MRPLRARAAAGIVAAGSARDGCALQTPPPPATSHLHGVPGLTVDVYANGDRLLSGFEPGTLTDPVKLPEGTYDLQVFPEGEGPDGDPAIEAQDVRAGGRTSPSSRTSRGRPAKLTPFVNDVSRIDAGQTRLTVRHTAAAPAVDVRAGGDPVFENLTNPNEAKADLPPAPCPRTSCSPAPRRSRSARPT
jgi:hypothetical protein